jgi:DNA-binding MarR family transcriptional regulator
MNESRDDREGSKAGDSIRALQARDGADFFEHSALLYLIHELSRLISTYVDNDMAEHRLTHAQWWALMHILENEGVTQTELADILQMGRASAGKLLERLEAKHWIERRLDARDSRARRVYLAEAAVPIFALMIAEGRRVFKSFLAGVAAEEEAQLLSGLRKIKRNAQRRAGEDEYAVESIDSRKPELG